MHTVNNEQLKTLREIQHWKKEVEVHERLLAKAKKELDASLYQAGDDNISPYVINLVLLDRNGSGVGEILKENEIKITE